MAILPLPPAAEISDIVAGVNQMYNGSPLPVIELLVSAASYEYSIPLDSDDNPLAAYAILLVPTSFQKTIFLPLGIPVGTRLLIKDMSGNAGTNMIIIQPEEGLLIDGQNQPFLVNVNFGSVMLFVAPEGVYTVGRSFVQSQYFDSLCVFDNTLDSSVTVGSATNAMSVGPLTIATVDANNQPVNVTISTGARWVII